MHLATTVINDDPILCVVTDRGVAPIVKLDPTLPTVPAQLQTEESWAALVSAVEAAPGSLFVPLETVDLIDG